MDTKGKLYILRGIPASGKSAYAKEQVRLAPHQVTRVNRDDLRAMAHGSEWSKQNEQVIVAMRDAAISTALRQGRVVLSDDTNTVTVKALTLLAQKCGAEVEVREFPISIEEAIRRDALRTGTAHVGEDVIRKVAALAPELVLGDGEIAPEAPEALVGNHTNRFPADLPEGLRLAVIVDMDGTAAWNKSGRSYYDVSDADALADSPNPQVIEYLKNASARGRAIIVCSGREDSCRAGTEAWLEAHLGFMPDLVLMRVTGDQQKDNLLKRKLYEENILGKYAIDVVLDDRSSVVRLWRDLGLQCWAVADGDF